MSTRPDRQRNYLETERRNAYRGLDNEPVADEAERVDRQTAEKMAKALVSATSEAGKGGASSKLMLALYAAAFFIFSSFLYTRPYLRVSSSTPYKELKDTFQHAAHFVLKDTYVGQDFFNRWQWETFDDPTHGRVNYVDQEVAKQNNLSYASDTKFIMRADSTAIVPGDARGRDSVRILSNDAYDESVTILDLAHMPEGCSTWPAFWTLSQRGPWPNGGEIDIIEGVNLNQANLASLHTSPSCSMPQYRDQNGFTISTDCDAQVNFNQGCGVKFAKPSSYGDAFNAQGGGWFVMVRTRQDGVRIWFWSRNDPNVPSEIHDMPQPGLLGGPPDISPNPSWGNPEASFPIADSCDYDSHFDAHSMVFDLTFCGDWAGADYPNTSCGSNCVDYVNNNPGAFSNAYWEINSLRVYTPI
ncbi:hypothetical protein QCA50_004078 [Cerrena zonata]|uniref:GH16 domain-containing protein n=1 Tax=Cerrena zonata TaxID=2478898 RepID=A0AAW0GG93_9APHY